MQNIIREGVILISTEGAAVGQINGLSVLDTGDFTFGIPSRITARVSLGSDGVVDVEREIDLSGKIHSKGVMILSAFLAAKYAQTKPLSLSASLTFEQLYNEVDGDSASSTELYALLSALSGLPLRQDIAVTGSVNQKGEVQAVGGVQFKVEGFFDVCTARGLTGTQGVMIPRTNVNHIMLREDIVEAVRQGKFHLYAVSSIDEGIEVLTGVPAGQADAQGAYPEGSVNALVDQRLTEFADKLREFGKPEDDKRETGSAAKPAEPPAPPEPPAPQ
jgi:predicted ATP-dependent protease